MSDLKPFNSERIYWAVEQVEREAGDIADLHLDDNTFYIKSEADKVIAHYKYKRCLAMAKWCRMHDEFTQLESERIGLPQRTLFFEYRKKAMWWNKWHKRWLEIAEKFKEAK